MRRLDANIRRTERRTALLVVLVGAFLFFSGCGANGPSQVVATYRDGGKVTKAELDKFIAVQLFLQPMYALFRDDPEFRNAMLMQYVGLTVLSAGADETARKETAPKVREQVEALDRLIDQNAELKQQMNGQGLSNADFERFFELQLLAAAYVGKNIAEQDVRRRYEEELARDPHAFDVATVRHILVGFRDADGNERTRDAALARANEVKRKLEEGGDFAELAKTYSDDPGSKDNGGLYEDERVSRWVEPFRNAVVTLPIGQISDPVETDYGFHVIRVESRRQPAFEEVGDDLRQAMVGEKIGEFVEKEVPALIETNRLPSPSPSAAAPSAGG